MPNHPSRNKHTRPGPLMAPNGAEIMGTLELAPGFCGVSRVEREDDGAVAIFHVDQAAGPRTEYWYEDQETVTDDGHIILVDVEGNNWRADQLIHQNAKADPSAKPWAPTTHVSELIAALRAVLPYAHSRAEDMHESGHGDDPEWLKADAAVTNAYKVLGETA